MKVFDYFVDVVPNITLKHIVADITKHSIVIANVGQIRCGPCVPTNLAWGVGDVW